MTSRRELFWEMLILGFGITGAIAAHFNGQRPWVCLLIGTATMFADEVLIRLRAIRKELRQSSEK